MPGVVVVVEGLPGVLDLEAFGIFVFLPVVLTSCSLGGLVLFLAVPGSVEECGVMWRVVEGMSWGVERYEEVR